MENMAETQICLYMEESQVKMTAINVGSGVYHFYFDDSSNSFDRAIVGAINGMGVQGIKSCTVSYDFDYIKCCEWIFNNVLTKDNLQFWLERELQGISKTLVGPFRILPTVM